ncbi:serine/threonine-protein kinase [Actinophytocola sp.]|uniref:serine/threonine-protein kinase n=1 Tax=Actinophytocola sp. TaxID=1872138 RepID=UPI002D4227E9|nr:serine/threonine-protein kinase [Actinophytocola sp.]HYQ65783.1 serine/threonine-protein kinase [Actinophytocola sp.]
MRSDDVIADRYRLVEVIGAGGLGIVWLADDLRGNRSVALKRPGTAYAGLRADLEREAEAARKVVHPNAVKVFDVVGDGDDCWLVMEYFRSTSLGARGILPPQKVAAIGAQVAAALAAAHAVDVVHGDVAPGNILVAENGTAKVTDLGISAWRPATVTGAGEVAGTVAYIAPEVADGGRATAASDVFSLGASLFAAVEGEPPFGKGDPDACLRRLQSGRAEIPVRSGALRPVLDALLQRDQAARPTAAQARELLDRVASGQSVPAWPGVRKRPRAMVVAGVAVAVAAMLVLMLTRPWESGAGGPARTVLGDPRTANPCALADTGVLSRFGEATLDPNRGEFNRCDVLIAVAGDDEIDVEFRFGVAKSGPPASSTPSVVRHEPERDRAACDIALSLADQHELVVTAKSDDDVAADFCQVADVAADHVESVLRENGRIPRRPAEDPRSLVNVDACGLLTGVSASTPPVPGFGKWRCRWPSPDGSLQVIFDRDDVDSAREGSHQTMSGRDVYVAPAGYGEFTCAARIFHLRYQDEYGASKVELALVVAEGGAPMGSLCQLVTRLAGPVAARLPSLGG